MKITGLKIAGFKSFADPVDVDIREGLTGIVGPNGCGKSNILEALRWVMGATSARAMRGGEMDDLIFSGSAHRPSREHAEVALILDNSSRTAPAELNDADELEVKRRLRRGAGSTYKINNRTVRAKDVQLLFADASTGANSPALVRQGQISELIASKPQNRRRILEEAAGIAGLNARRHEAELKLRAAAENLARLDEIIGEVEKQHAVLKRQASRAQRYREIQAEIDYLEAKLAVIRWRTARHEAQIALDHTSLARKEVEDTTAEAARNQTAAANASEHIAPLRAAEAEAAGKVGALALELAQLDGERKAAADAITRLEADLKRVVEDLSREHALREEADTAAKTALDTLAALPQDDEAAHEVIRENLSAAFEAARERLQAEEIEYERISQAIATADAEQRAAKTAVEREEQRIANLERERLNAEATRRELGDANRLETALKTAQQVHSLAAEEANAARLALETAEAELHRAQEDETKARQPMQDAEKLVRTLEAEIAALDRLLTGAAGPKRPPILDELRPEAGLERAIAAALGDDLNASRDKSDPQYWSETHAANTLTLPEGATPLSDMVDAPQLLGARLSQCGLVKREDGSFLQGQLQQGQRLVSLEGDLWRWDGFVRTAEAPTPAAEKLQQRTRRKSLTEELAKAKTQAETLEKTVADAANQTEKAKQAFQSARISAPETAANAARAREQALRAEQDIERLHLRTSATVDNIARINDALEAARASLETARQAIKSDQLDLQRKDLEQRRATVQELRQLERDAHNTLLDHDRERDRAEGRRRALKREAEDWKKRAETADARLNQLQSQRTTYRQQLDTSLSLPDTLRAKADELNARKQTAESERQTAADRLQEAEKSVREFEAALKESVRKESTSREALARTEARLEAAQQREQDASDALSTRFEIEPTELAAKLELTPEDEDTDALSQTEQHLNDLKHKKEALGGVNLEADTQAQETAARLEQQLRERDDLDAALAKLHEAVHALNKEGRARLMEAFEVVSEHFSTLFETLFEGGEARLELTESDDPLEAGLEIYASPPEKRLSALSLMSGGEQALTAAALIFAVFLSRPSPLCVLDEVDAPLDDANVDRFCRMLDAMRKRTDTRFVAITHNPVTMARMDRLFGVTMQERGVSRLVSVDLQSAEQLVAAE